MRTTLFLLAAIGMAALGLDTIERANEIESTLGIVLGCACFVAAALCIASIFECQPKVVGSIDVRVGQPRSVDRSALEATVVWASDTVVIGGRS